jgi:hypothetical protein
MSPTERRPTVARNLHDATAADLRAEAVDAMTLARNFAVTDPRRATYTAEAGVLATLALSAAADKPAPARRKAAPKAAPKVEEAAA